MQIHKLLMLYLASQSPRRHELLRQIGVEFIAQAAHIDETPLPGETAEAYVKRMSIGKAQAVQQQHPEAWIIGSDTAVVCGDQILGKPQDQADAVRMLTLLSNRTHRVLTGVALVRQDVVHYQLSDNTVSLRPITEQEALDYWDSGEPRDKAGAYAIQGYGAVFVKHMEGSYSGIMGLPIYEMAALLAAV